MENKRYFPLDKLYKKRLNYAVYGLLQCYSYRNPDSKDRYIYKNELNVSKLCKELKMGKATFGNKIKALLEEKIIKLKILDDGTEVYFLPADISEKFLLLNLSLDEIKTLIFGVNGNVFKMYLFLKDRSECLKKRKRPNYKMEIEQKFICKQIGLSEESRDLIPIYADILKKLGFIDYELVPFVDKSNLKKRKYVYTVLR